MQAARRVSSLKTTLCRPSLTARAGIESQPGIEERDAEDRRDRGDAPDQRFSLLICHAPEPHRWALEKQDGREPKVSWMLPPACVLQGPRQFVSALSSRDYGRIMKPTCLSVVEAYVFWVLKARVLLLASTL